MDNQQQVVPYNAEEDGHIKVEWSDEEANAGRRRQVVKSEESSLIKQEKASTSVVKSESSLIKREGARTSIKQEGNNNTGANNNMKQEADSTATTKQEADAEAHSYKEAYVAAIKKEEENDEGPSAASTGDGGADAEEGRKSDAELLATHIETLDQPLPKNLGDVLKVMDNSALSADNFFQTLWLDATKGSRIGYGTRQKLRDMKKTEGSHPAIKWHLKGKGWGPNNKADLNLFCQLLLEMYKEEVDGGGPKKKKQRKSS